MSISNYREKKVLEAIKAGTIYVKLHKGNPGENGTENAATEAKRIKAEFEAPTEEGMLNSNDIEWPEVSTTEEYTMSLFGTLPKEATVSGTEPWPLRKQSLPETTSDLKKGNSNLP